jgi:signal transduction histidine kinase
MSGAVSQVASQRAAGAVTKSRSTLAHLLHALNQPLTGLQCSLELAVAGRRRPEEYMRTLREGLELTERMRILVEAIRELTDAQPTAEAEETFNFIGLLRDTADDLRPVAAARGVRLVLLSSHPLSVKAARRSMATLIFRLLESALALTQKGSDLQIVVAPESERLRLVVSWNQGPTPQHSPFSRQELALLIAQAGFERAGGEWNYTREGTMQSCTVRPTLTSALPHFNLADQPCGSGDSK